MKKLAKKQMGGTPKKPSTKEAEKSWMEKGVFKDTHLKHNYDLMKNATKSVVNRVDKGIKNFGERLVSNIEGPKKTKKLGGATSKYKSGGQGPANKIGKMVKISKKK